MGFLDLIKVGCIDEKEHGGKLLLWLAALSQLFHLGWAHVAHAVHHFSHLVKLLNEHVNVLNRSTATLRNSFFPTGSE